MKVKILIEGNACSGDEPEEGPQNYFEEDKGRNIVYADYPIRIAPTIPAINAGV
jgi:hypothetical protein